ncbi:protein SPMIP7 [Ambystoma mexicanum]|uniref:protein SPMIP7 n=1 Tax=Ambystoma mexicanum TaxID=8296 RepID=UPI0037E94659
MGPMVDPNSQPDLEKERKEHVRLRRQICLPVEQGPEDRHDFTSFQDQANFTKFNPHASAQSGRGHYSLAPIRDDAALIDPISGRMAPGGEVEARASHGTAMPSVDVGKREKVKTAPPCRAWSAKEEEFEMLLHQGGKRWTSTSVSDAMLRARLGGWTSKEKVIPHKPHGPTNNLIQKISFEVDPELKGSPNAASERWKNELARKYLYTSATQRAYADVSWDNKLPSKISPPRSTLEKAADPVSRIYSLEDCGSRPEIGREIGAIWDRFQSRRPLKTIRPVTFVSPFPRIHQIPLYAGSIGAENMEDVDNPHAKFTPFTIMRTPALYSQTSFKPNIPGYAGQVHWLAIDPTNSNRASASTPSAVQADGAWTWSPDYRYRHQGPFSRMVTTVPPCNPFHSTDKKEVHLDKSWAEEY